MLFLDELAEFIAPMLGGLRQPLEEGVVRAQLHVRAQLQAGRRDGLVVTVEQLLSTRGAVVASTGLDQAPCMRGRLRRFATAATLTQLPLG